MTRLARDVTVMARLGAALAMVPAIAYGFALAGLLLGEYHWGWSVALGGLVAMGWRQTVDAFLTMYKTGRHDGDRNAWALAEEACEADHYCRVCGGPQ